MPSQKTEKLKNKHSSVVPRERAGRSDGGLIASYALRTAAEADADADHISGRGKSQRCGPNVFDGLRNTLENPVVVMDLC